jgi:hypothetical protein
MTSLPASARGIRARHIYCRGSHIPGEIVRCLQTFLDLKCLLCGRPFTVSLRKVAPHITPYHKPGYRKD